MAQGKSDGPNTENDIAEAGLADDHSFMPPDFESEFKNIYNTQSVEKATFLRLYSYTCDYFSNMERVEYIELQKKGMKFYGRVSQLLTEFLEVVYKVRIRRSRNLIET